MGEEVTDCSPRAVTEDARGCDGSAAGVRALPRLRAGRRGGSGAAEHDCPERLDRLPSSGNLVRIDQR